MWKSLCTIETASSSILCAFDSIDALIASIFFFFAAANSYSLIAVDSSPVAVLSSFALHLYN